MSYRILVVCLICTLLMLTLLCAPLLWGQSPKTAVELWDSVEFAFQSPQHHENPFRDVSLKATFSHAGGQKITVDGFYDGDRTWKVRFMPTRLGQWSYTTVSGDSALNGKTGSLDCVPVQKPYLHGPLKAEGFHFRYADGQRPFLISTRLSCQFAGSDVWNDLIPFLQENRINRVLFMIGGIRGTVKDLYGDKGGDLWSYNTEAFKEIDAFIQALRRAEIIASPYFYYFDDRFQRQLTPEQDEAFLRYAMARFGAFANVMPVLSNEVELKYTERKDPSYDPRTDAWANRMGKLLRQLSVFGQPVTVHNPMESYEATNPSFFTLLHDWPYTWADLMLRQAQVGALGEAPELTDDVAEPIVADWNARAFARHNDLLIGLRRFKIPVVNEEPGYEMRGDRSWDGQTSETMRATFWTAALAGAYTMWGSAGTYDLNDPLPEMQDSGTPADLRLLAGIFERLPFWEMQPSNELVNANPETVEGESFRRNFVLAAPGRHYLIYSLEGGPVELTVPEGIYQLGSVLLSDPEEKHSVKRPSGQVTSRNGKISFFLDPSGDWVALLQKVE